MVSRLGAEVGAVVVVVVAGVGCGDAAGEALTRCAGMLRAAWQLFACGWSRAVGPAGLSHERTPLCQETRRRLRRRPTRQRRATSAAAKQNSSCGRHSARRRRLTPTPGGSRPQRRRSRRMSRRGRGRRPRSSGVTSIGDADGAGDGAGTQGRRVGDGHRSSPPGLEAPSPWPRPTGPGPLWGPAVPPSYSAVHTVAAGAQLVDVAAVGAAGWCVAAGHGAPGAGPSVGLEEERGGGLEGRQPMKPFQLLGPRTRCEWSHCPVLRSLVGRRSAWRVCTRCAPVMGRPS